MQVVPDYRPVLGSQLRRRRRMLGEQSLEAFARIYLAHHLGRPPSRMHRELYQHLARLTSQRSGRLAVAAPRGHAKTTVTSLGYVLWSILYHREPFVLLLSATRDLAVGLLKTIKTELQTNPLLLEDFPEACQPVGSRPTPKPWKDNEIVLRTGICIRALGAEQRMRGMKFRQHRPSLIVVDDLEEREQALSEEQRGKLWDWFERTLLKIGEPRTNVVVVGTILHHDSLLARLVGLPSAQRASGWQSLVFRAVERFSDRPELWEQWEAIFTLSMDYEGRSGPDAAQAFYDANHEAMLAGTSVLWPELEDYRRLMEIRTTGGRLSFQSEKQNEPIDPDECLFREEILRYWSPDEHRDPADLIAALGSRSDIYGACDPSMGRRGGTGDYSAIVLLLHHRPTDHLYVLEADIARRSPDQTMARIIALAQAYDIDHFVLEDNGFQALFVEQLEERARDAGVRLRIGTVTNTADKKGRIQTLEPLVAQGRLRFSRRHVLLLEQLRQFPLAAHDDGPEALHMAAEAVREGSCRPRITTG